MTRRALVIRAAGDEEIAGAIADALVPMTNADEIKQLKAEMQAMREREAKNGVAAEHTAKNWHEMYTEILERPLPEPSCKVAQVLLIGWAMLWMQIYDWYDYLSRWNREK